jgi:hypothetical protein
VPYSFGDFRPQVLRILKGYVRDRNARIVDVGPGDGSFGMLLIKKQFSNVVALEVFSPYVERFQLRSKYRQVFIGNVVNIRPELAKDSLIVLSDVLEHLYVKDAKAMLARARRYGARAIVVTVPWLYEQGADDPSVIASGNSYEIHRQADLTPAVFHRRYPQFVCVARNSRCGVYLWDCRPACSEWTGNERGRKLRSDNNSALG